MPPPPILLIIFFLDRHHAHLCKALQVRLAYLRLQHPNNLQDRGLYFM